MCWQNLASKKEVKLLRVPDFLGMLDGNGSPSPSVPASFLSNDLIMPSAVYPSIGNPMCPNDGWNGYTHMAGCNDGPWEYAQLGYVVGSAMPSLMMDYDAIQSSTWGWGVFYATDANAVDSRCFWADGYKGYEPTRAPTTPCGRMSPPNAYSRQLVALT